MEVGEWSANGEWRATKGLNELYREIRSLDLESNVAELEAFGFTVVHEALTTSLVEHLRATILEREQGADCQQDGSERAGGGLLLTDQAFERAILEPRSIALVTYLLGHNCRLDSLTGEVAGAEAPEQPLQSDNPDDLPSPFSPYNHIALCKFVLSEPSESGPAISVVPGSHHHLRQPEPSEQRLTGPDVNPNAIHVAAPVGSAVIWQGNTWCGSAPFPCISPRVDLVARYCRQYIDPREDLRSVVPADFFERHDRHSKLATLLGFEAFHGFTEEGPDKVATTAGLNWYS